MVNHYFPVTGKHQKKSFGGNPLKEINEIMRHLKIY